MQQSNDTPTIRIALEWFLNPDHLPLLWAREQAARDGTLNIELIVPDDHYDGFAALGAGEVEAVVNEPLHLLEKHAGDVSLQSLGTFFHTEGGVLISRAAQNKLRNDESIRVTSPVSNPVTDGLCRDIILGVLERQGYQARPEQITVYQGGFDHVANLQQGADAAWLAFANIEGVHVQHLGLPVDMWSTTDGGVPGFSALELIGKRDASAPVKASLGRLVEYLDAAVSALVNDPEEALALWYRASGNEPSELTRAMVVDTVTRFVAPVRADASRWRAVWSFMRERGADIVGAEEFEAIFSV